MDTHNVGLRKEFLAGHVIEAMLIVEALLVGACAHNDIHFKGTGCFADQFSDCAIPDEAECATLNSLALGEHSFVPFSLMKKLISLGHAPVDAEHEAHGQLGDSVRILAGAVGNVNPFSGAVCDVDGVGASACANNQLKFGVGVNLCDRDLSGTDD